MFSFVREGTLFLAAGAIGAAAGSLLPTPSAAGGFVGGLTLVLPVMTAYALGISAAVRMPGRAVRPVGAALGLAGAIALFFAAPGLFGWGGALGAWLAAALGWIDGPEAYWRGAGAVGFTALIIALVLIPIIPLARTYIFAVSVAYLLLRHLWGVLSHDVPVALRHNSGAAGDPEQ